MTTGAANVFFGKRKAHNVFHCELVDLVLEESMHDETDLVWSVQITFHDKDTRLRRLPSGFTCGGCGMVCCDCETRLLCASTANRMIANSWSPSQLPLL
jgi:hypothetical protein